MSFHSQQIFALDHHTQQTIKTENEKVYQFPSHAASNKSQILSDTKLQPSQIFDVRNADGQIVHVNIEDINQFLTYHEVFGKISNTGSSEHTFPNTSNTITIPTINVSASLPNTSSNTALVTSINQSNSQIQSTPLIIPKIENISAQVIAEG